LELAHRFRADLVDRIEQNRKRSCATLIFYFNEIKYFKALNKGSYAEAMTRKIVSLNINVSWKGDNSKSIRELGMRYRPLKESMTDFF
jgi:hypothetical protein